MNAEDLCVRVRRCKNVCVVYIRRSVCAERGLEIPKQALLEMITLIKPLLSKLPPTPLLLLPPSAV